MNFPATDAIRPSRIDPPPRSHSTKEHRHVVTIGNTREVLATTLPAVCVSLGLIALAYSIGLMFTSDNVMASHLVASAAIILLAMGSQAPSREPHRYNVQESQRR